LTKAYNVEIENLKYVEEKDLNALKVFTTKIGADYFGI